MRRFLNFFSCALLSFAVVSCSTEPSAIEIPKGVIIPDSMVQLLADLHLAESRLLLTGAGQDAVLPKRAYIELVLKTHRADTAVFIKSFDFYSAHPEVLAEIYTNVITEISKRQAEK